jgi:hypothetical protein
LKESEGRNPLAPSYYNRYGRIWQMKFKKPNIYEVISFIIIADLGYNVSWEWTTIKPFLLGGMITWTITRYYMRSMK